MSGESKKLHLAVNSVDGAGWTGGAIYIQNIVAALHSLEDGQRPKISLLIPAGADAEKYRNYRPYVDHFICLPSAPSRTLWTRIGRRVGEKIQRAGLARHFLGEYLRERGVDCVYTMGDFGPQFPLPLLSWIFDFQHLHLPEICSGEEIEQRNSSLQRSARYGTRVILSSENARSDFQQFAPSSANKARVLRFVAQVPSKAYEIDPSEVCSQYSLPQRFLYLPNQFWKHKNHSIVIDALQRLKRSHPEIVVVCTGNTSDYRNPQYFAQFLATVSERGLRNNFIILGLVPHADIFPLMRQSLAVLQPSFFEGWSTTVEEAKSLGKRMIVSDIPVHHEQNPPGSIYFDPHDAGALADAMIHVYAEAAPDADRQLEQNARANLKPRTLDFANTFMKVVGEVAAL